jgi:hypothetical protein
VAAGLDMNLVAQDLAGRRPREASIVIANTAGSGTMEVTFKLWGYAVGAADWVPLGVHVTAASKGVLNDANALGETEANAIGHAEPVFNAFDFPRLYLEITAISGTATAVTAWLQWRR